MHVIHNNEHVLLGFGGIRNMMYQTKPIEALQDVSFSKLELAICKGTG